MTVIGILSDTHLQNSDELFRNHCALAFNGCDIIIHAGDLTDMSLFSAFAGKIVHAVHGNMCNPATQQCLPERKKIVINGFSFGICHGAGSRYNIEERMLGLFPDTDCIIYGHTHQPVCHTVGKTLVMNPGSFRATGKYGAPGTYGLLRVHRNGLKGTIHELPL
jgi:putative phosphoesterase